MKIDTKLLNKENITNLGIDTNKLDEVVQTEIEKMVNLRFRNGVDPFGIPWQKTKNRNGKTLVDTGKLKQSIHKVKNTDGSVGVSTNLKYAKIHNYGGVIKPKIKGKLVFKIGDKTIFTDEVKIPQRQFFGFSFKNKEKIRNKIAKKIKDQLLNKD